MKEFTSLRAMNFQTLQKIFDLSSTLIRFELKCVTLSTDKDMANGAAFLKKELAKGIPMLSRMVFD